VLSVNGNDLKTSLFKEWEVVGPSSLAADILLPREPWLHVEVRAKECAEFEPVTHVTNFATFALPEFLAFLIADCDSDDA
jgi:hypothetical protein